ncbi:MAG: hypothetical protein M1297_01525 [Nitrospirae bacterium]|nr:hypothetical protein [Nitrospirota bacterium]MCL5259237.1 hypothetical protein [Nitrospirota bacterium]
MFGIGWPDFLFIAILLVLVVKPEEWPKVGRVAGKTLRTVRQQAAPIVREFRSFSDDLLSDPKNASGGGSAPEGWEPLPQSWQKGGESSLDRSIDNPHAG